MSGMKYDDQLRLVQGTDARATTPTLAHDVQEENISLERPTLLLLAAHLDIFYEPIHVTFVGY